MYHIRIVHMYTMLQKDSKQQERRPNHRAYAVLDAYLLEALARGLTTMNESSAYVRSLRAAAEPCITRSCWSPRMTGNNCCVIHGLAAGIDV